MKRLGVAVLAAALFAAAGCDKPSPTSVLFEGIPPPTNPAGDPNAVFNPPADSTDTTPPVVAFALPATSGSLVVGVSLVATDDVGVTGYALTEVASHPAVGSAAWTASPPSAYTFTAAGAHTLYGWAKDAAGNVSNPAGDSVTISDATAPVVTVFTLTPPASGLVVAVALTATDEFGVTGYLVNESAAKPLPADAGWLATKPTSYTAAASGPNPRTVYAWAKDLAGNVSAEKSASVLLP